MVVPDIAESLGEGPVATALRRLSKQDQVALLLLVDGYTVAEIAVVLGCSGPAASMRLRRAKDRLKTLMDDGGEEVPVGTDTERSAR
jgi:DNA-directed RNA polymerase specialized sigma24 family protein